jgi:hypothetical protein
MSSHAPDVPVLSCSPIAPRRIPGTSHDIWLRAHRSPSSSISSPCVDKGWVSLTGKQATKIPRKGYTDEFDFFRRARVA